MQADDERAAAAAAVDAAHVPSPCTTSEQAEEAVKRLLKASHLHRLSMTLSSNSTCTLASHTGLHTGPESPARELLSTQQQLINEALYLVHISLPTQVERQNQLWMAALEPASLNIQAGMPSTLMCLARRATHNQNQLHQSLHFLFRWYALRVMCLPSG